MADDFIRAEAEERRRGVPEEADPLYKRHFVAFDLEERMPTGMVPEEFVSLTAKRFAENFGAEPDVIVTDGGYDIASSASDCAWAAPIGAEGGHGGRLGKRDDRISSIISENLKKELVVKAERGSRRKVNILVVGGQGMAAKMRFVAERDAELDVFEWYASPSGSRQFMGIVHEFDVGGYGRMSIDSVHAEGGGASVALFSKGVSKGNGSLYANAVYCGGRIIKARNEMDADGTGAACRAIELALGSDGQKFDIGTTITNTGRGTASELESKAALTGDAVCMFKGFASVGEGARDSSSLITERGIVLGRDAYMDSIPGMSISNSNVKAAHSSATMPLDEDMIFYMRTRGVGEDAARELVVKGFFASSLGKIGSALMREVASALITEKMNKGDYCGVPKPAAAGLWAAADSV